MPQFKSRPVGRTGLEICELGLGTATMAGIFADVPFEQGIATIGAALDAGITFYDTAPQYGFGRAEHTVGDGLRRRRAGTTLSSKVGRLLTPYHGSETTRGAWVNPFPFDQVYDYSYDGIMRSFEDSLQRLGLANIDILLVHDIGVMTHGAEQNAIYWKQLAEGGYRALTDLKASGQIKAIGLGVNEWEVLMDAFGIGDWDIFLLAGRYTLLEQTSLDPFLTTCLKRGSTIIAGAPFNGGALMGTGKWNYGNAPAEIIQRVADLETFCKARNVPIGAAALQFPLAHPAVSSVLVGPKSPAELAGIVEWWNTPIADDFWHDLAASALLAPGTPLPGGGVA